MGFWIKELNNKELFNLYYQKNKTRKEIAKLLNVSLMTIRRRFILYNIKKISKQPKCINCKKLISYNAKRCHKCKVIYEVKIGFRAIKNHPRYKGVVDSLFCRECGEKISKISYYGNKRCKKCAGRIKRIPIFCKDCGEEVKNRKAKRCKKCFSKYNRGKNHHQWGKPARHSNGEYYKKVLMRSYYEIAYAKYLDKNNIKWKYEPKAFDLGDTTYTPDFYLPETNTYIEIKGWWRDDARSKFLKFKHRYKENIIVLNEKRLLKLGIKIRKEELKWIRKGR